MNPENPAELSEVEREGKIRLSLIDVIYGVIMGYGFNFFVDRDPTDITFVLFLLTMAAIVTDWLFVHKPYWQNPDKYTNLPFLIDLIILLTFAFMIRFSVKPPQTGVLFCFGVTFSLYTVWDVIYREPLKNQGRSWLRDSVFDGSAAITFFLLWRYSNTPFLAEKIIEWDLPDWMRFDIEVQTWMVIAVVLFIILGPHPFADKIKKIFKLGRMR